MRPALRSPDRFLALGASLIAVLCVACLPPPHLNRAVSVGRPTTADIEDVPVHGFEVEVTTVGPTVEGELLAVDVDCVWILSEERILRLERHQIQFVRVDVYDVGVAANLAWTLLGTLSTGSHGYLAAATAPIWLVTGTSTMVAMRFSGDSFEVRPAYLPRLAPFARFPQGMPPQLVPAALRGSGSGEVSPR